MSLTTDEIQEKLKALPPEEYQKIKQDVIKATAKIKWLPNSGPQTEAYYSPANILLYGGQGGGGKSDLSLGLAFTAHQKTLILRRRYTNLGALIDRALEINGTREGYNGSPPPTLRTKDGKLIQFGANANPGDEEAFQGQPYDLKVFDEAVQFLESQVRFHLGWIRSTNQKQRTRAILATNPPTSSDGDWIIKWFRPWLDLTYEKPAKHGDLRWFVTAPDGTDIEVENELPVEMGRMTLIPTSRTFIPAALKDNPFLIKTDYQSRLDALPEPLRSAVRDGNFMAARADAEWQVIPTQWVIEAQSRWKEDGWKDYNMTAMGFDPAGGGKDAAELCWRHGGWFANIVTMRGEQTADGSASAAAIISKRRHNAPIIVDVGGGYGGAVTQRLSDNGINHVSFNANKTSTRKTADGQLGFYNKRAEAWWQFREALNPDQEGGSPICLPPSPELRSDLTAPTYEVGPRGIQIESKEKLRARLGRSPGKGDSVVMALAPGDQAQQREIKLYNRTPQVNLGYADIKRNYR